MRPSSYGLSRQLIAIILSLLTCVVPLTSTTAQTETTGAIEGQVFDSQKQTPVAGIVVQLINQETEVAYPVRTDAKGLFVKQQLLPGNYTISVRAPGYQPYMKPQAVFITQRRTVRPDPLQLIPEPTAIADTTPDPTASPGVLPTPTSTPPAIETGTEDIDIGEDINTIDGRRAGNYPEKEVKTLPLGAVTLTRTFDELALLLPGVAPPPPTLGSVAGPGVGPGIGSAGQFAVNGLRSRGNNFTVDGSDNNDEDIGVRRQGFLALVPQPIESIQEYQVITLLAPAQYGRNFGAQVNAVSRSGGNETHGTIYGFLNTSQLNSRDFFDTANCNARTPLTAGNNQTVLLDGVQIRNLNESGGEDSFTLGQGGFVLGGPLVPEKGNGRSLFYFVSAAGHILNAAKEVSFAVPTVEQRGTLRSGATGLTFNPLTCRNFSDLTTCTGTAIDYYFPTSLQGDAIFSLFPFPNNPTGIYGRNTLTQVLPADGRSKIASGKFDANFGAFGIPHQLSGRYNFTDDFRDIPATGGAIFSSLRPNVRTQNFSLIFNSQISDAVANQFRASYGRTRLNFEDPLLGDKEDQVRDLRLSEKLPGEPFLLNARYLINNTLPLCSLDNRPVDIANGCAGRGNIIPNTGPVFFGPGGTTESGLNGRGFIEDGAIGPVGQVIIAGLSPVGVDVFNFPQRRVNNTYQIADTLSSRIGRHSLAFGTDIRRAELNSDLPRNSRTLITFNGAPRLRLPDQSNPNLRLEGFFNPLDLAAAQAASGTFQTLATPGSSSNIGLRYYQLYFFGQDEWRIRSNLSLSYGLRYEYTTPAREVNRNIERQFNSANITPFAPGLVRFINGRTEIFDADRNNFAPRIGIAYSPRPSTVIRAGYGWFYDQIIGAVVSQSRNTFPNFLTLNSSGGIPLADTGFNIFNFASPTNGIAFADGRPRPNCFPLEDGRTFCPYTLPDTLNNLNPSIPVATVADLNASDFGGGFGADFGLTLPAQDVLTPMAQHYSVTLEQQLGSNTVVSAAYVGTQGRHLLRLTTPNLGPNRILLPFLFDQNSIVPDFNGFSASPGIVVGSNGAITLDSNGNIRGGRPTFGNAGAVYIYETSANSRYDALQVQLRGRYARGLQYQGQYTFSHAEDDVSDVFDLAGASALPQNSRTRAGERADANFDVRHRFSYNVIYGFPDFNDRNNAFRFLLGGLELASTGQFQTGQPFTVNSIFDVNLDGNLTDRLNTTNGLALTDNRRQLILRPTNDPGALARQFLAPIGQDGSVPRNSFRASNLLLFNVAAIKHFRFGESQDLTFRAEVFNLTNRDNFGIPVRFLEAPGFGEATDTVTPGRRIQFALKYSF
ncbi:hypothetical protein BH18ACI2_BH18ACI2_10510 [soil metagenome]